MNKPSVFAFGVCAVCGLLVALLVACSLASATATLEPTRDYQGTLTSIQITRDIGLVTQMAQVTVSRAPTVTVVPAATPEPTATLMPLRAPDCGLPVVAHAPTLGEFLAWVWPEPDSTLTLKEHHQFQTMVRVDYLTEAILEPGDLNGHNEFVERFTLMVDDHRLDRAYCCEDAYLEKVVLTDKEGNVVAHGAGPTGTIACATQLDLGTHKAAVLVNQKSGEVLEYTWTFTITP